MEAQNEITKPQTANERLNEFLKSTIEPASLAKKLRRANYILAITNLTDKENSIDMDWANDSYFWINELAEILDPNLDIE